MRPRTALAPLLAASLAAAFLTAVTGAAGPAGASPVECTYTPHLPKRIVVSKPTVNFRTPVTVTSSAGSDCTTNFTASESLTHSTDTYFLNWTQDSHTASDAVYAVTVKPGTYTTRTPHCTVIASAPTTCAVGAASTIIKFGGTTHLTGTRLRGTHRDEVRFSVSATHYQQYRTAYVTTKVAIQRSVHGQWVTVHTATTRGSHGFTWTATDAKSATYRAVSAESASTFAATSRAVVR